MITKHSQRCLRHPCRKCGAVGDLYWGHDSDKAGSRRCNDDNCPSYGELVSWVLIDRSGQPHRCDKMPADAYHPEQYVAKDDYLAEVQEVRAEPVKADADGMAALANMLAPHLTGVDAKTAEQVAEMVSAEIAKRAFPTVVVVEREEREPVKLDTVHKVLPDVLRALQGGEHVMMVGPAGTGKSTVAEQCAESLGAAYYAISLSPQTPASALLGYQDATGNYVRSLFRTWYAEGGIFHFDEMDNAHPSILATINAALANGHMAFPDGMQKRHPEALACGSANTYGRGADRQYVGRSPIDAATLDRFTVVDVDYDEALEDILCAQVGFDAWSKVTTVVRNLRQSAESQKMSVVISPRASVGICRLLKAGWTWNQCVDGRLRRGLSDADWQKLSGNVSVTI
jgi:cobaltochelatase CobS